MDVKKILDKAFERDQKVIKTNNKEKSLKVFKENTEILKKIIYEEGWPTLEKYEEKTIHHAWIIAQHSDFDLNFQIQCLGLFLPEIKDNKDLLGDCAYIIDRILLNNKAKQVFGTQMNNSMNLPETISPSSLDKLRSSVGLEPIKDYLKLMKNYSNGNL